MDLGIGANSPPLLSFKVPLQVDDKRDLKGRQRQYGDLAMDAGAPSLE